MCWRYSGDVRDDVLQLQTEIDEPKTMIADLQLQPPRMTIQHICNDDAKVNEIITITMFYSHYKNKNFIFRFFIYLFHWDFCTFFLFISFNNGHNHAEQDCKKATITP